MITSSIKTIYQASLDVILAAIIYFLGKIPWRRKWQATPALLPGKFCELRSLVGYSSWGHKESDMTEQKAPWCHILVISPFFKPSHYYYASYSELWPVIFDVTIIIILGLHEPGPYKAENIINKCCVCFDCPISQLFPVFLPFLGPPFSLRHNNFKIRTVNDPTMASKFSSEKKALSLSHVWLFATLWTVAC